MVITNRERHYVSTYSSLSLLLSILPMVHEFINRGELKNAQINLTYDDETRRLRAIVTSTNVGGSVSKAVINRNDYS